MKLLNTKTIDLKQLSAHDEEPEDSVFPFMQKGIQIYSKQLRINSADVYLDEAIGELTYYRGLIQYLHDMSENDTLRLWVDSPGGNLDTTLAILDAIQNCQGEVLTIVTGNAASAASLIALCSPNLVLGDRARFFLHSASYGTVGKQGEIESYVDNSKTFLREIMQEAYEGFLTEEEMNLLLIGKDYYFRGDELRERVMQRTELLNSRMQSEQGENTEESWTEVCLVCDEPEPEPEVKPKRRSKRST